MVKFITYFRDFRFSSTSDW